MPSSNLNLLSTAMLESFRLRKEICGQKRERKTPEAIELACC